MPWPSSSGMPFINEVLTILLLSFLLTGTLVLQIF